MFGFGKAPEKPVSDGLATFLQRVTILEARVTSLELDAQSFRDKVLRKIQKQQDDTEEKPKLSAGARVRR